VQQQIPERAAEEIDIVLRVRVDRRRQVGWCTGDQDLFVLRDCFDWPAIARIAATTTAPAAVSATAALAIAPAAPVTSAAPATSAAASTAATGPLFILVTSRRLVVVQVNVIGGLVIPRWRSVVIVIVVVVAIVGARAVAVAAASPTATAPASSPSPSLTVGFAVAVAVVAVGAVVGTAFGRGSAAGLGFGVPIGVGVGGDPDQRLFAADPQEAALTLPNDLDVDLIATTSELT
jgi:hypothetical protein